MNLNFLCCIGAEQKHDQSGLLKMNQIYFYRAYADETMSEILEDNFFNHSESHLKENDIILAYSPNEEDLPKVRWLRIVIPHAGLVKTEQVDNSYLLEVLRNDLGDLGDQVAGIEEKIPETASGTNHLITKQQLLDEEMDIREDMNQTDSELQTQITAQAGAINDLDNKKQDIATAVNYNNITNCITEIPQDIKLEIVDGAVVLKAGSKVYVPNGAGVFNVVTIANDIVRTTNIGGIVFVNSTGTSIYTENLGSVYSGDSAPSSGGLWYDTANNLVKYSTNGQSWSGQYSFPIGIVSTGGGQITSIDQVFNGFGYIGSTVFALPGVKGLTPDGRNEEGTLKNVYWTTSSIILRTYSSAYSGEYDILFNGGSFGALKNTYVYDEESNYNMDSNNRYNSTYIGRAYITSGTISYFATKNAFHAVDYSDTGFIAHQSMPSDKYIDLNLGQSGAVYTAPADGFVCLRAKTTVAGKVYCITNEVNGMQNMVTVDNLGGEFGICLPVSDGQVFSVEYGGALDSGYVFRFVFLNAAK